MNFLQSSTPQAFLSPPGQSQSWRQCGAAADNHRQESGSLGDKKVKLGENQARNPGLMAQLLTMPVDTILRQPASKPGASNSRSRFWKSIVASTVIAREWHVFVNVFEKALFDSDGVRTWQKKDESYNLSVTLADHQQFTAVGASAHAAVVDMMFQLCGCLKAIRLLHFHQLLSTPEVVSLPYFDLILQKCIAAYDSFVLYVSHHLSMAPTGAENAVRKLVDLFGKVEKNFVAQFSQSRASIACEVRFFLLSSGKAYGPNDSRALRDALRNFKSLISGHPEIPVNLVSELRRFDPDPIQSVNHDSVFSPHVETSCFSHSSSSSGAMGMQMPQMTMGSNACSSLPETSQSNSLQSFNEKVASQLSKLNEKLHPQLNKLNEHPQLGKRVTKPVPANSPVFDLKRLVGKKKMSKKEQKLQLLAKKMEKSADWNKDPRYSFMMQAVAGYVPEGESGPCWALRVYSDVKGKQCKMFFRCTLTASDASKADAFSATSTAASLTHLFPKLLTVLRTNPDTIALVCHFRRYLCSQALDMPVDSTDSQICRAMADRIDRGEGCWDCLKAWTQNCEKEGLWGLVKHLSSNPLVMRDKDPYEGLQELQRLNPLITFYLAINYFVAPDLPDNGSSRAVFTNICNAMYAERGLLTDEGLQKMVEEKKEFRAQKRVVKAELTEIGVIETGKKKKKEKEQIKALVANEALKRGYNNPLHDRAFRTYDGDLLGGLGPSNLPLDADAGPSNMPHSLGTARKYGAPEGSSARGLDACAEAEASNPYAEW